jgi:hypothetical protein
MMLMLLLIAVNWIRKTNRICRCDRASPQFQRWSENYSCMRLPV